MHHPRPLSPSRVFALAFLALTVVAAFHSPAAARPWRDVGHTTVPLPVAGGTLEVSLRPDHGPDLRLTPDGPHRWLFAGPTSTLVGGSYSILLRNRTPERLKVVVGVDGVNVYGREVIGGSAGADVGSILLPWSDRTLPGWQLDDERAQRFVFSPPEWSEGEGRTDEQIGLVTVQVYREWQPPSWSYEQRDGERGAASPKEQAARPAEPSSEAGVPSGAAGNPPIGTTAGDDVYSAVRTVHFVPASDYPEAWTTIDYGAPQRAWQPPAPRWDDLLGLSLAPAADGTRIVAVTPGSPADRAGLAVQDVILRIDTVFAPSPTTTRSILRSKAPGDYAFLRVRRGPHELAVKIRT
jgi:hypothetical protein